MLRAHIPPTPAVLAESQRIARENLQRHYADHAYNAAKNADPYRQREADKTMLLEMRLREATGQIA